MGTFNAASGGTKDAGVGVAANAPSAKARGIVGAHSRSPVRAVRAIGATLCSEADAPDS